MKFFLLFSIFIGSCFTQNLIAQAITYHYSANTGNWATPATWELNNPPNAMNRLNINIFANHTVTHYGDLVLQNSITINVHPAGNLIIDGNVNIGNNSQHPFSFEINGTATIHGNLDGYGNIIGDGELHIIGDGTIGENMNYDVFGGIIFINGSPLPIELVCFSASTIEEGVLLNWSTATETNNMGFKVQRLENDIWQTIGFVPGNYNHNGVLHYSHTDFFPLEGINYYRLKQMDFDGAFEFFGPVAAWHGIEFPEVSIQIMKTSGNIYIVVPGHDSGQLEVFDIQGRLQMSAVAGGQIPVNLGKGTYFVRFNNGFKTATARFII
ncbi:MAG: T9SS C-terminal target domain-containing protein [Bacteroidetes bacterium]|nr:MAG: T9SS C-terminal target domain-containing protein [Bacteroidota bacterium]